MSWYVWAIIIIVGLLLISLIIVNVSIALNEYQFNKYCEERASTEVKKKMNKKEKIQKLLEKVESLSDRLKDLSDKYEQTSKDLEYLKFKQDVKGNMLVNFNNYQAPDNDFTHSIMYISYKDENEGITVCSPVYPALKYLENNQVVTLKCTGIITANIFEKIVATNFPNDQYIIKLVPEKKYYKSEPIYMFADLRHRRFDKLTLKKCQELGVSLDIDKSRKWVEI